MPPAADLDHSQADLILGDATSPADQDELRRFIAESLNDYAAQLDALAAEAETLENTEAIRICHRLHGSLRTIGFEHAGLLLRKLEAHWSGHTADQRVDTLRAARASVDRAADALHTAYPWLAPTSS